VSNTKGPKCQLAHGFKTRVHEVPSRKGASKQGLYYGFFSTNTNFAPKLIIHGGREIWCRLRHTNITRTLGGGAPRASYFNITYSVNLSFICALQENDFYFVGFEVLTSVVKSSLFWDITLCSWLKVNRRFGGTCRLHLLGRRVNQARYQREMRWQAELFDPQDGGDMFLRNVY
jgi:hypothetical protein